VNEVVEGLHARDAALFRLPTFERFEALVTSLAAVREEVAMARESSAALIDRIDGALAAVKLEDGSITIGAAPADRSVVASYLTLLFKGYINSGAGDAKVFGRLMREDVLSIAPPVAAVEIGCRRWRQKSKFLPAIAELLVEVKAAKAEVENAVEFGSRLPALRERMARELDQT
jgi:hypothetical protein